MTKKREIMLISSSAFFVIYLIVPRMLCSPQEPHFFLSIFGIFCNKFVQHQKDMEETKWPFQDSYSLCFYSCYFTIYLVLFLFECFHILGYLCTRKSVVLSLSCCFRPRWRMIEGLEGERNLEGEEDEEEKEATEIDHQE